MDFCCAIINCKMLFCEVIMEFKKEDLFTIPNILTYIRLICIPIFAVLMITFATVILQGTSIRFPT